MVFFPLVKPTHTSFKCANFRWREMRDLFALCSVACSVDYSILLWDKTNAAFVVKQKLVDLGGEKKNVCFKKSTKTQSKTKTKKLSCVMSVGNFPSWRTHRMRQSDGIESWKCYQIISAVRLSRLACISHIWQEDSQRQALDLPTWKHWNDAQCSRKRK